MPVSRSWIWTFTSKCTRVGGRVSMFRRPVTQPYNSVKVRILSVRGWSSFACAALLTTCLVRPDGAQTLPSEPLVFGDGRVTVGADVAATISCAATSTPGTCGDDTGFFNYSDYEYSTLRMFRVDVNAVVRANRSLAVVADVRSENGNSPRPYALYAQLRPWAQRDFEVNGGRVPPTFGAFTRRTYASDNLLIGYPLAYQYLTP